MSSRSLADIERQMGSDLRLDFAWGGGFFEDADLALGKRADRGSSALDVTTLDGLDNFTQAVANRLKTRKGELASLGHPDYGSRHHELVGEPNVERVRNLIKLYVLQALAAEPRIASVVSVSVSAEHAPPRDSVRIELTVLPIDRPEPVNLIVPFFLGGGAP